MSEDQIMAVSRVGKQTKDCRILVSHVIALVQIPPGKAFFRWTWHSILLPENWVSWISPNIWQDTGSKWTHRLQKEADNLERSLCWGCYPWLSGEGSGLECHSWKDCPVDLALLNTNNANFFARSRPYQCEPEASRTSGPGRFFFSVVCSRGHQESCVDSPCQPSFCLIKFWHLRNPLWSQSTRLCLSVLVRYWAGGKVNFILNGLR